MLTYPEQAVAAGAVALGRGAVFRQRLRDLHPAAVLFQDRRQEGDVRAEGEETCPHECRHDADVPMARAASAVFAVSMVAITRARSPPTSGSRGALVHSGAP